MTDEEFNQECERKLKGFQERIDRITEDAFRDLKRNLITNHGKKVWLSKFEASGLLNIDPRTVMENIPSYDTTENGGSVRFLLSDINAHMKKQKTKKG